VFFAQAIQDDERSSRRWSNWKTDTAVISDGTKKIVKKRQKYKKHGWRTEEIVLRYDECGCLIRKTKTRSDIRCFGGKSREKYDKVFKSSCHLKNKNS
jgi:hypothetical protein